MKVILTSFDTEQPCDNTVSDIVELDLPDGKLNLSDAIEEFLTNEAIRDVFRSFFGNQPGECTMLKMERVDG